MSKPVNPARELATRLAAVLHKHLSGRAEPASIAKELKSIVAWIERGQPEPQKGKKTDDAEEKVVLELFQYWLRATGRAGGQTKLTDKRRTRIRARLRDGYTVRDLRAAIDGCANSAFHKGENDRNQRYDDLELIFRNGENVEKFRDMDGGGEPAPTVESGAQRAMREALSKGDMDAYDRAKASLSSRR